MGIVARIAQRRQQRLHRLGRLSEAHLQPRQELARQHIPRLLIDVSPEVKGPGLLVLPESVGRRPGDQLCGSEVWRDGEHIYGIGVGGGEIVLAVCRQRPQVIHARVLRVLREKPVKDRDCLLQLVRADLRPRDVAPDNPVPRLYGDYPPISLFRRGIIAPGKSDVALEPRYPEVLRRLAQQRREPSAGCLQIAVSDGRPGRDGQQVYREWGSRDRPSSTAARAASVFPSFSKADARDASRLALTS